MARVSRAQAGRNRIAIEEASSRLFREQGINGVSVADLMAAAGLTHGGFYGHFESKDALAAIACARAFANSAAAWKKRSRKNPDRDAARAAIIAGYLSARSRNASGIGCPLAALAADVAREPADKPVRQAYLAGLNELLEIFAGLQRSADAERDRSRALAELSTMVGALVLARATQGDRVSDEFLVAARQQLISSRQEDTRAN